MDAKKQHMISRQCHHIMRLSLIFSLLMLVYNTQAQSSNTLTLLEEQTGTITADVAELWAFDALADEIVTIRVNSTNANLDPYMTIRDTSDRIIFQNDDLAYPDNLNPIAEAITIPRTGTYTVEITGFGRTSGTYTIQLLPGYGDIARRETFDTVNSWTVENNLLTNDISDGVLTLGIEGLQQGDFISPASTNTFEDFYVQVDVNAIDGRNGWETGIILRQQGDTYYLFTVNSRGNWQFSLVNGESRQFLRDYVTHPAIVAGESTFTLGTLANENGFDVFYNGQFMGQVLDTTLLNGGRTGIYLQTANAIGSEASAQYDNFVITTPFTINQNPIFPTNLVIGTPQQTVQELERRRVIPPGGTLPLNVPSSFVDSRNPGVVQQSLGRNATFTNFVMGTTAVIQQNARPDLAACGLLLQAVGENDYIVAFIDNAGGYGISTRNDDTFDTGIFDINAQWVNNSQFDLTVVMLNDITHLYVNSQFTGSLQIASQAGEVGNVLINFEATETTCEFTDTWLWQLED